MKIKKIPYELFGPGYFTLGLSIGGFEFERQVVYKEIEDEVEDAKQDVIDLISKLAEIEFFETDEELK